MPSSDFVLGSVKWFNPAKGYGFIICDGKDVFIHSKRLRESGFSTSQESGFSVLDPGDRLKFKIEEGPKGAFAVEISKVP